LNPSVAAEWYPAKNGRLAPRDVTQGSRKRVWWQCRKGMRGRLTYTLGVEAFPGSLTVKGC